MTLSPTVKQVAAVLTVVVPLFVPEVVLSFTPFHADAAMVMAGMLPTVLAWVFAPRYAAGAAVLAALANTLAVLAFGNLALTALLAGALALLVGLSARRGLHIVGMFIAVQPLITLVAGFPTVELSGQTPGTGGQAVLCGVFALGGGLWALAVGALMLRDEVVGPPDPVPVPIVGFYTAALLLMLVPGTVVAASWFLHTTAGWLLATIVLVTRPTYDESRRMIVERSLGTVVGGLAAAGVALVVQNGLALVLLGTAAMVVAAVLQLMHARYAYFAGFLTAAVVLVNAERADVLTTGAERILWTVLGALAVAAVVTTAEALLGRHSDRAAEAAPSRATS
ncbi:FUSC family protein [Mycolicibacterium smegmatis]|uniref:Integral membrane bound transporter domain-containing protein n=3 Tax=Mycolicibacterium smegmatis TaxID=1772 RepID=A0R3N7_MYCS2|nr:FUSC family protein [Mycolicibacterium smegmatis]ABK75756.1 hypothetical protein MSMEG_5539 [Mycolicibacterium smegmatis MC2 155]AFP41826.1 hypothetical protein MSMEI_5385 [Mycolicibacterium smegmatis MC2 155]AIU10556.1 hypothetical protein LJ00_27375 [Mycolicibacterium smegmatis MC2 155]AIU17181.1 hypothetical protein LI99_27380 [Mycolicibacterium smegmatis]AIU23804.1 hypothetical protein LI98_27385 [Mycolicibacterium smegmatis]